MRTIGEKWRIGSSSQSPKLSGILHRNRHNFGYQVGRISVDHRRKKNTLTLKLPPLSIQKNTTHFHLYRTDSMDIGQWTAPPVSVQRSPYQFT